MLGAASLLQNKEGISIHQEDGAPFFKSIDRPLSKTEQISGKLGMSVLSSYPSYISNQKMFLAEISSKQQAKKEKKEK